MSKDPKHIVIDARIRRSSTGRYADRLVEHLQEIDHFHRYTILVEEDDPWKMHAPNFHTVRIGFKQFSFNPIDQLRFSWKLYKLKPSLVHFTMTQQPLFYFGKIVTTTHDLTMFRFERRGIASPRLYKLKIKLYHFMMWVAHHKSRRIIVPTKTVAHELEQFEPFTSHKLAVTYEASEPPLKDKPENILGLNVDFIMYVGTAFPHKNLDGLIKAFDILHQKRPKLKLVLVGKKERYYEALEEWARDHPSFNNIIFAGFISDPGLIWLFTHCRAYVFASLSEGFGLPPLEAMTYGAPVAASNASCIPEILGDAANYFDATKTSDMVAGMSKLLDDEKFRQELIRRGYDQVKKYSWRHMAQETLTVYKSALEY